VCPTANQTYTLRVIDSTGATIERYISLFVGSPTLSAQEVIAHGVVNDVAYLNDVDTAQPGEQQGYRVTIDGIGVPPLFASAPDWGQSAVTLMVQQTDLPPSPNAVASVDWPIVPGQQVEFRAFCNGANCTMRTSEQSYLRWRS
jgi:hypothetical protein